MTRLSRRPEDEAEVAVNGIGINDVYVETGDDGDRFLRVLWIDVSRHEAHILRLGETAYPSSFPLGTMGSLIASGVQRWVPDHPFKRMPLPRLHSSSEDVSAEGRPEERSKGSLSRARVVRRISKAEEDLILSRQSLLEPLAAAARDGSLFGEGFNLAVTSRARETGTSRATLTRLLRTWFEYGMSDAALGTTRRGSRTGPRKWTGPKPGKRIEGKPVGIACTPRVRDACAWAVKWLQGNRNINKPLVDGYIAMIGEFFSEGTMMVGDVEVPKPMDEHLIPTERQFRRYCAENLPRRARERRRRGEKHYENNVAPVLGTTSGFSFGPGSMSHLDSSPIGVKLVDTDTGTINLGQPTLTFVIDDFATLITGRHVTLAPECSEDALLAIADSMEGFIKAPRALPGQQQQADIRKMKTKEGFTDKGGGYLAELNNLLHERLGASVANPPGGTPHNRGRAEHRFRMMNAFIAYLPGAIRKRQRGKGNPKQGGDACLSIGVFMEIVDEFIRFQNSTHRPDAAPRESFLPDGRPRTAFDLLLWGIRNRGAPDRATEEEVRLFLYEQVNATVDAHGHGLNACQVFYVPVEPVPGLDLSRPRGHAKAKWKILRDRERIGRAWLLIDEGAKMVELRTTKQSAAVAELTAVEWDVLCRLRREGNRNGRFEVLAQRTASNAVIESLVKPSRAMRVPKCRKGPVKEMREHETRKVRKQVRDRLQPEAAKFSSSAEPSSTGQPPALPQAARPAQGSATDRFRAMKTKLTPKVEK